MAWSYELRGSDNRLVKVRRGFVGSQENGYALCALPPQLRCGVENDRFVFGFGPACRKTDDLSKSVMVQLAPLATGVC